MIDWTAINIRTASRTNTIARVSGAYYNNHVRLIGIYIPECQTSLRGADEQGLDGGLGGRVDVHAVGLGLRRGTARRFLEHAHDIGSIDLGRQTRLYDASQRHISLSMQGYMLDARARELCF